MNTPCAPLRSWIWHTPAWTPAAEIPLSDRGFRYGMALFETLRIRARRPEHVEAHLQRLLRGARTCGFPLDLEALTQAPALLTANAPETGVARLYVSAGDGGPADPIHAPRLAVLLEERPLPPLRAYTVRSCPEAHLPPLGGLKTANYWANAESLRQARAQGADEALLFRPDGVLIGACMGNVFVRLENQWHTPALECGARDGVMRAEVLARLPVQQSRLPRTLVERAEALLLTNSWIGVVPVHQLDGRSLAIPAEYEPLRSL